MSPGVENGAPAAAHHRGGAVLPAAAIQRQIVAHEATIEGAPAYNLLAGARLQGPVDTERLDAAFSALVAAHPALRARLVPTGDGLAQAIAPPYQVGAELEAHEVAPGEAQEHALRFARRPIDVFSGPPLRLGLFSERPETSVLALVLHHAFGDGHSLATLCTELGAGYAEPIRRTSAEGGRRLEDYRRQILAAEEAAAGEAAMAAKGPPAFRSGAGAIRIELCGERRTKLLRERARAARVTPFTVALTAFSLALRARFDFQTVELSVPVTTRTDRAAFELVGPLMRMARVGVGLSSSQVQSLLAEVQKSVLRATFSGGPPPGAGAWTLEHGLAFAADVEPAQHLALPGVAVEPIVLHPGTAVFGLTGTLETVRCGGLRLRLEAAAETLAGDAMEALLADVLQAIDALVEPGLEQEVAA